MLTPERRITLMGRIANALPTAGLLHPLLTDCMSALADDNAPAPEVEAVPGEQELIGRAPEAADAIAALVKGMPWSRRMGWVVAFTRAMDEGPRLTGAELNTALTSFLANVNPDNWTTRYFDGFARKVKEAPAPKAAPTVTDDIAWSAGQEAVAQLTRGAMDSAGYAALPKPVKDGLKRAGGWPAIRDAQPKSLPFLRRDYLAGYRSAE